MNLQKYINKKKKIVFRVALLIITFIFSILLPLYVYLDTLTLNLDPSIDITSYLNRLEQNTLRMIIVGILILGMLLISYLLNPILVYNLGVSILTKVFYMIYIIFASDSEIFELVAGNVYIKVDLSVLNYFLLVVPSLFILRSIIKYTFDRKELKCTLYILKAILVENLNSKKKIRKFILKNKEINQIIKRYILKNFNDIMLRLETSSQYPLIVHMTDGYNITKAGREFFDRGRYKISPDDQFENTLQVWTESDLRNLARKRAKKNVKY